MLAYLISAYRDPPHLARLIQALDFQADFYIHIDANTDGEAFRRALPEKVHYVPRHKVSWGGWEQVAYQHELLRAALNNGRKYSHLVCLSGQDYPLWSNHRIHRFFDTHKDSEMICGYNLTRGDDPEQLRKITRIHPFRDLTALGPWWRNKLVVSSRHLLGILGIRRHPQVAIGQKACDVYFGSDYWAITPACARYVTETLEREKDISTYFRTTFVPSELCLQTIIFNSPFAEKALLRKGHYPGLTALTPLHYINYGSCIKILTLEDWTVLQESGKMLCRKVVTGISDGLRERIDSIRREELSTLKELT